MFPVLLLILGSQQPSLLTLHKKNFIFSYCILNFDILKILFVKLMVVMVLLASHVDVRSNDVVGKSCQKFYLFY